jgi:hypothetical protein
MSVAAWVDRMEAADAIYRYGAAIDAFDHDALRAVLDDEITAQYGQDAAVLHGPDAVVAFIRDVTRERAWQHHFLNVYRADVQGDHASVLVYHMSHQALERSPETVHVLVARYHNELRRRNGAFRISKLYMEILGGGLLTPAPAHHAAAGEE